MDENISIKQEKLSSEQKNTKKVDGKYIFIPEGYMSVIIPIDENAKHRISSVEPNLYPTEKLNTSIPNTNHPNHVVSSSLNLFTEPEIFDPTKIVNQKNHEQKKITIDNFKENKYSSTIQNINSSLINKNDHIDENLSIEKNSKSIKDKKQKKIPRPKNSFIFYLKDKTPDFLKINPNINRREVSKAVGQMWRNESEEVKKIYAEKARIELEEHKLKYPNYKFAPDRSKKIKKNNDESKKGKDIKSRLSHQRTSSEDLSLIKEKITKKPQLRQRSISNSIFKSKKLDEIYKENKIDYDQEDIENDQILYQTIINSIPYSTNTDPQALEIPSTIVNNDSFSSIDGSINSSKYTNNDDPSFIGTDYSSSFFDELSLSSFNNSFSEINAINITNPNNILDNMNDSLNIINPNSNLTGNDPVITNPSSFIPLDVYSSGFDPLSIPLDDSFSTVLPSYQTPLNNIASPLIQQSTNDESLSGIHTQVNGVINNEVINSPSFNEIIAPVLNTTAMSDLQSSFNNMILPESMNQENISDINNMNILSSIPPNDTIESTIIVPSNDTSFKSKRLSQIQQKNNLRIVTSAENLTELVASYDIPSSATTTTTTNTFNTDISNSNGIDTSTTGSNKSTPSYLISKMSLMENFDALNLNNSSKHKNHIHTQPHLHARSHRHNHYYNNSQCNSASIVMDNKPAFPLAYPMSAGLKYTDQKLSFQNGSDIYDFSSINSTSASASGPSTHSGATSAITNASGTHSFNFCKGLDSRSNSHENLEVLSSNSSIHSTTRTSSSIVKKNKSMSYSMKLANKKNNSLSKLNKSNSLLSTSESYDSSIASSSSSFIQLNPDDIQSLCLEPAIVTDPQPTLPMEFLNFDIDNNDDC